MRSSYNNKKIMAALAAAAMFGVGPAMAASSIFYVDNATKQKIAQPAEFHPLQSCSNQEVSVADGYVVAANQSYVKLADAIKYTCDSEKGQQTSNNKDFEGKSLNYAIVDVNGTTIEVANGTTTIECPENYRYNSDKTKCEEVEYSYAAGDTRYDNATCPSDRTWNSEAKNCGTYFDVSTEQKCRQRGYYWNNSKCYGSRSWSYYGYTYTNELQSGWQSSVPATCPAGYTIIDNATSLQNACMKATCPQGYEPSGLAGNDACRSLNKLTGRTTSERVYKTSVTRYEGCEASVAKSSPLTGDVVKYAEADTAFCELGVDKSFTLIGKTTQYGVTVGISSTVNLKDVSINALSTAAISIDDGATVKIKFTGTNTLKGAENFAGIAKTSTDGKLTIDGTSKENNLSVTGGYGAAGIGGNVAQEMTSNIEVLAGTITAKGGQYGAAIGGGQNGAASTITIGNVTDKYYYNADDALTLSVTGGNDGGAGIGGGSMGGADNIVINNGYITANAPATAAIGAGAGMSCKEIIINNGVLHAVGGTQSSAIGASGVAGTSCEGIVINNGSINAYAGSAASGDTKAIGKKESVTITGGSIMAVSSNETYDDIMNPKDAQGSPVHRFNIKATSTATDNLFVRSTETGKLGADADVELKNVYVAGGNWDNGKFFPTHHLDVGMDAGGAINQQDQIWAFFGENEEHDLMVNPSVTEELSKTVASSGKTSRIKWDATQSEFIYNIALLNSFPHDVLVYNGYEQGVKVDSSKIWIMGPDSSAFVTLSKSSSESKANNYFKLNGDSLTNANVKCQEEFVSRNVSVTGTTGAPVALYCDPAGYLEGASDTLYTMTAKDKKLYGKAQHVKFMLPYVLDNMEIANSIEPQSNDEKDPIVLADGFNHLIYNGAEQTQEVATVTLFNKTHYVTDKFDNYVLVADQDYEVLGNKGTDASKFDTLKISAKGTNFVGEAHRNFVIKPFDLANAKVEYNPDSLVYNMREQGQYVDSVFICADEDAAKDPLTNCYQIGRTNQKDLYTINDTIETNAGSYNATIAATTCENQEEDFCSNVTGSIKPAYNIAKYPIEKLEIAFNGDTMVYNGGVQAQKIDVSLKTLIKKTIAATEESEAKVEFVVVGSSSSNVYEVLGTDVDDEFDTLNYKAINAGWDTLTLKANDVEKNFTGSQKYGWQIGARDLAGNVWGISSSASTVCANYAKCVAGNDSVITANVGKYGCRAVYPCDKGFEGYAKASVTPDYRSTTFNAEVLVNEIKNVKFSNVVELAETDYVILTADSIKDHEADFIYNGSKTLSNTHLNVRGNDQFKDYCIRHVHTDRSGNKFVCHNPYMSNNRIGYYSDDGRVSYECTEEYADYGADEMGTSDYCASFETQEACEAGKRAAGGSNVSTNTERCYDYHIGENTMVEKIYIAVGGVGNFKGIDTASYVINPADIGENKATIVFANNLTYNAKVQEKVISELTLGDFRIAGDIIYKNFVIKGNVESEASDNGYNMVITGIKNYKGTAQAKWGIAQYDITDITGADVTPMFNKVLTYNPDPLADDQIQKVDSAFIVIGDTTVKLTYSSSSKSVKDAGNYTIDLQGTGNFTGTYAAEFTVAPFDILKAGYQVAVTSDAYVSEDGDPTKLHVDYPVYNDGETITQKFAVWTGAKTLNEKTGEKVNYTYTGNTATQVGSYNIVVTGQGNYTGTISTTWVILDKEAVLVTVELKNDTVVYDGQEHVWGGKDIIKSATYVLAGNQSADPSPFDVSDLVVSENVSVKCTNVNDDCSSTVGAEDITVKNHGTSSVVIPNPSYKLVITPAPVTVAVAGKTDTVTFDNEEHKFAGYDVTIPEAWTEFLKAESFSCTGCDSVAGKDAGEYALGLAKEKFANANGNFDVTFDVTDGKLVIDPAKVQIKLYGNTKEVTFNGERQEVSGFSVPKFIDGNQNFVTLDDIKYTGDTSVSAVDAGIYEMVIDPALFSSANKNFNIEVTEYTNGKLTIKPAPIDVKITGNTDSKYYAARKFTVYGYDVKIEGDIEKAPFSKSDIAMVNGTAAEVSAENVKMDGDKVAKYMMGLKKENFASRNQNYDVNFMVVADGYLEIKPVEIVVTIAGNRDTVAYNKKKQKVEGVTITATDPNFGVNDYEYTGPTTASGEKVGVVYMYIEDKNHGNKGKFKLTNNNYTLKDLIVKDGLINITKADAIQTAIKSDVKVRAIESGIVVDNANGKAISVFTMNGKTVYSSMRGANTFGSTTISVPKGMYIVKVGSAAQRVNVK